MSVASPPATATPPAATAPETTQQGALQRWLALSRLPFAFWVGVCTFTLYGYSAATTLQLAADEVEYIDIARHLLAGDGFLLAVKAYHFGGAEIPLDGLATRSPLLPFLIAGLLWLGLPLVSVQVVNALLAAIAVGLLASIAARLFGRAVGVGTGLLATMHPVMFERTITRMTEPLAICLTMVAVWLTLRADEASDLRGYALAGLALGLGYLARPTMLAMAAALIVGILLLLAGANFALFALTWANYLPRYQVMTLLFLLPIVLAGLERGLERVRARLAARGLWWGGPGWGRSVSLSVVVGVIALIWSPAFVHAYGGQFVADGRTVGVRIDRGVRWSGPAPWVEDPGLADALDWIEAQTAPGDVVAAGEPWPLTFFTGRPSTLLPQRLTAEQLRAFIADYRVTWVALDGRDRPRCAYREYLDDLQPDGIVRTTVGSYRFYDVRALWR